MPINSHKQTGNIELYLSAYKNCDDVLLFWRSKVGGMMDQPIPNCIGFCIERQRRDLDNNWGPTEILRNRVGFTDNPPEVEEGDNNYPTQPSNVWPFQRYNWTDHGANNGQIVRYRVIAVSLPNNGTLGEVALPSIADTDWTPEINVNAGADEIFEAYFNRGTVMSQYISRIMRLNNWTPAQLKAHIKEIEEPVRRFLSGELRNIILAMLDEVINNLQLEFYAALYELSDKELIDRLKLLRGRAHIVLANGSDPNDGNASARTELKAEDVDVQDRLLSSGRLGHNKFGVVVNKVQHKAVKCWTGSTNWAPTGLCTQLNNGLLINDSDIAQIYLDQWHRLDNADNSFPPALINANGQSPRTKGNVDVWFTTIPNDSGGPLRRDLQELVDVVNGATEAILYVMFQPGPNPLSEILLRMSDIYVKGVVSTVTSSNIEKFKLLNIDVESREYDTAIIQPEGVVQDFASWVKEVTRSQFLFPIQNPGIGHAITHAKMMVIDPHTDNCVVITGSHNFSGSASEKNDENFVVIRGARALAEAYSVACIAIYEHYRWRAYVKDKFEAGEVPWSHLSSDSAWQSHYLNEALTKQLEMWVRQND